ncbi:hypothetical protein FA95DRAFT_1455653, partial [Auriscalpium vulgare]
EIRDHVRTIMTTIGKPLHDADSPKTLIRAILHAMIGYYNLLERGWKHRDVSVGNVLLLKTPEKRDAVTTCTKSNVCMGMLIDGDQAVNWPQNNIPPEKRRSGTPQFMSTHILAAWVRGKEQVHTVLDDLESFVWVLIWSVMRI